MSLLD